MNSSQLQKPLKLFTICVAMRTKEHQSWLQNWAHSISASGKQRDWSQVSVFGREALFRRKSTAKWKCLCGQLCENVLTVEWVNMWSKSSFRNCTFDFLESFPHEDTNSGFRCKLHLSHCRTSWLCQEMALPLEVGVRLLCLPNAAFLAIDMFFLLSVVWNSRYWINWIKLGMHVNYVACF